ncbi:universal stress protein [Methanobacterium sp. SMA-27]|uniref:universal stress protein n=1 Tax=Methanobacterium sp. SMA-27 TaxID=1495336 RepID=UPI00064E6954|nr:universal stress protein [Methanobacterium sp. SMA-27]
MSKKILLPTDGSKNAERAGEYAISLADISGADIIILNVIDTYYLDSIPQPDVRESVDEELRSSVKQSIERFEDEIEENKCNGKCKNVNFKILIKEGKPADIILQTIDNEGIDQVIIGKSGKHGLERLLLGRTTDKVVKEAKVPVNVIS